MAILRSRLGAIQVGLLHGEVKASTFGGTAAPQLGLSTGNAAG